MNARGQIVDAWMQHPSRSLIAQPMLDPLRRWSRGAFGVSAGDVPLAETIRAMDDAGVRPRPVLRVVGPARPAGLQR